MIKRLIFSGLILLLLASGCGVVKYSYRKVPQSAILSVVKKDGLYVRLRSEDERMAAMRKYGKELKLKKMEKEVADFNEAIVDRFTKLYDFSEVYFYYSRDADAIFKERDGSKVLNSDLEVANVKVGERIGVMMGEGNKLYLHKWENMTMTQLDKFIYQPRGLFFFRVPTIFEATAYTIPRVNMDFKLYQK